MKQLLLPALVTLLFSCPLHAQLGEFRVECTTGDSVRALAATAGPDGSIYVLGSVANGFNNPAGNANDAIVTRIDNANQMVWSREYDPGTFQSITDISSTEDGGFVLSGTSTTVYFDGFLAKGNPDGTLQWSQFPGNPDLLERGFAGIQTADGGYIFAGHHSPDFQTSLYLVKYDAAGAVEWGQYYPVAGLEATGYDIAEVPAGGYLVTGSIGASFDNDAFVVRLNEQGEQLWANTYSYQGFNGAGVQIAPLLDGTFALLQGTSLSDAIFGGPQGAIISRINLDGSLVWSRVATLVEDQVTVEFNGFNFSFYGQAEGLIVTPDDHILFVGGADADNSGDIRPALAKISTDGEMLWGLELAEEGFLSGPFRFGGSPLTVTSEGYYAYVFEDLYDREGFRMVKVDEDGQGICADPLPDAFLSSVILDVAPISFVGSTLTASADLDVNIADQDFSINPGSSSFTLDLGNDTLICSGASLLLDPALDSTATYQWQDGSTDSTFTVNASGIYSVTVTQDECTAVDSIAVVTPEDAVALGPDLEVCDGEPVTLGPAFEVPGAYAWSNGAATPQITVTQDGAYTLELTTACGVVTDEINVNMLELPDVEAEIVPPNCGENNGSITINLSGGDPVSTIEWLDSGDNLIAEGVQTIENLSDGSYEVVITVGPDCFSTSTFFLVSPDIPEAEVTISPPNCQGEASGILTLDASGGIAPYQFEWSRNGQAINENAAAISGLLPGLYAYTVTDATGCAISQDSIVLPDVPPINFQVETVDPACPGEATGLIELSGLSGGTPPYTFALNGGAGQTEAIFQGLASGLYEVTITDSNDCDTTTSITLAEPNALSIDLLAQPNPASFGDSVQLEIISNAAIDPALSTLQWAVDSGAVLSCTTCPDPSLLATSSVDVELTLTLNGGCTYTAELFLQVDGTRQVYIPNAFSPNEDGINDRFEIYPGAGLAEVLNFQVYNRWGGLVFEAKDGATVWDGNWRGEPAQAGVYAYVVQVLWVDGFTTLYEGDVQLFR
ncbi:MAG: gliding motility-associated C-terminal domain-containing protein [bacterium]|nr:gliding motility-associated C-terminal domain-containing protein [bacterium]